MNHFAQELELLCAIPAVRGKLSSGDLEVHGLVFDAQSGAYLTYDRQQRLFQPLNA
jgi:carbonic anhydrase